MEIMAGQFLFRMIKQLIFSFRKLKKSWPGRFPRIARNAGNSGNDGKI